MSFADELREFEENKKRDKNLYFEEKRWAKNAIGDLKAAAEQAVKYDHKRSVSGYFSWNGYSTNYNFLKCTEENVPSYLLEHASGFPPIEYRKVFINIIEEGLRELGVEYELKLMNADIVRFESVKGFFSSKYKQVKRIIKQNGETLLFISLKW